MADLLGVDRDKMLGILLRFWAWLDRATGNGLVTHMSRKSIDDVTQTPGLSAALELVGWLKVDEKAVSVTINHFDRHNGNPAKTRALAKNRKRRHDERKRNDDVTPNALPEKRREEYIKSSARTYTVVDNFSGGGPQWFQTDRGIESKGKELGLEARSGESYQELKDRIFLKLKTG
jgi:hypothetical protein